jgi:hypothetical protein
VSGIDDINARIASSLKMRVVVLADVNIVEDDDSGEQHSGHGVQPAKHIMWKKNCMVCRRHKLEAQNEGQKNGYNNLELLTL